MVPFGALRHKHFTSLRSLIKMFWGPDQAKIWLDLIQDPSVTESPKNLLSLNHQIHWWFDNGKMALKPLRQLDDGSVVVQFHWLKRHQLRSTTKFGGNFDDFMQKAGLEDNAAWGDILAHRKSGLPLKTGQIFTLRAPADKPEWIPSFELLKLSWDMSRIIAISGAAEPKELWKNDDRDDDADTWASEVSFRLRDLMNQIRQMEEEEEGKAETVDSRD